MRSLAPVCVIAAFALVAAAAVNFAGTIWFTALQQHIPQHALSRVSSYDWAGSVLFLPLGYILVGPLADQFSASDVLYARLSGRSSRASRSSRSRVSETSGAETRRTSLPRSIP